MDGVSKKLTELAWLLREHREAVELEVIRFGSRLRRMGTRELSWRDVLTICRSAPPKSRLAGELDPRAAWGDGEYLLALVVDVLNVANWQRSKDGSKGRRPPKPIPRPGQSERGARERGRFKDVQPMSLDDMGAFLHRPRRPVTVEQ